MRNLSGFIAQIGKETHGWCGLGDDWNETIPNRIDWLRYQYADFGRGRDARGRKHNSPFFQAASTLQKLLNPDQDPFGFMWLNLFVCDQADHLPAADICERLRGVSFLRDEVRILKPHAVVFFTGSGRDDKGAYDYTITHPRYFPDAKINRVTNHLWSVVTGDDILPARTVRTYHPNYLWRHKQRGVLDEIADWMQIA